MSSKRDRFIYHGSVIDNITGNKIHSTTSDDLDDFDEFFTKTMRKKLR